MKRVYFVFLVLVCTYMRVSAQTVSGDAWVVVDNVSTNPVPVVITAASTPNFWPATSSGMGLGFTVCGFGWAIRIYRKTGSVHD